MNAILVSRHMDASASLVTTAMTVLDKTRAAGPGKGS